MKALIKYIILSSVAIRGFVFGPQRRQLSATSPLVHLYLQEAMRRATYRELSEDHSFSAEIPGFRGVYGYGTTIERAREELAETLRVWVLFRLEYGLALPEITVATEGV